MSGTRKKNTVKRPGLAAVPEGGDAPLFFYMPNAVYGEFCQWFPSTFTVHKDRIAALVSHTFDPGNEYGDAAGEMTFGCAEQFMMFCKAARFRDHNTQHRVMATDSPKEQKRLGKLVLGFNAGFWDPIKSDVVVAGNEAKFGQNIKLKRKLLATGDRLLAEAASRDPVWGIGYSEKHAMSFRQHWGENRLGKALMTVREKLREDGEDSDHGRHSE